MTPETQIPSPAGDAATDDQLRRELQSLLLRHGEFSRRLEAVLAELETPQRPPAAAPAAVQGPDLAALHERVSSLESQLDAVSRQVGVNSARITSILDSRTWKAFTGMGGVLLRLVGRR